MGTEHTVLSECGEGAWLRVRAIEIFLEAMTWEMNRKCPGGETGGRESAFQAEGVEGTITSQWSPILRTCKYIARSSLCTAWEDWEKGSVKQDAESMDSLWGWWAELLPKEGGLLFLPFFLNISLVFFFKWFIFTEKNPNKIKYC